MMQYARTDTGQRQLTDINALLEEAVQLGHSRRSLDRSLNVTIYTEDESATALSEVALSDGYKKPCSWSITAGDRSTAA